MKNVALWSPSKYVVRHGKLRASRCINDVGPASRLITDLVAARYNSALGEHCRGDVLDLGCGRAPLYVLYREFADTVTCVDWSSSLHDVCHADVLCDLNQPIPLADSSYDTVILSDVLEHLYCPQQTFGEIRRVMRPSGKLLMNVPFMYCLHEQPYDFYRYTRFALERMVNECGLKVLLLEELGGAPEVLADLLAKLSARIRFVGPPFANFVQTCCHGWRGTRLGYRLSTSTAKLFPLGYFLVAEAPPPGTNA